MRRLPGGMGFGKALRRLLDRRAYDDEDDASYGWPSWLLRRQLDSRVFAQELDSGATQRHPFQFSPDVLRIVRLSPLHDAFRVDAGITCVIRAAPRPFTCVTVPPP